jgi:O-succinylbenzoic acid--CoA ligase
VSFSVGQAAAQAPQRLALVSGEGRWTYGELAVQVRRAAAALAPLVGDGWARLTAHPTPDVVVRLLALWELNVTPVLLHPRWGEAERQRAAAAVPQAVDLDGVPWAGGGGEEVNPLPRPAQRPMAVLFTSGSSGAPKAVALSQRAFAAAAAASAQRLGWREADRWLLALPPAHVGGLSVLTRCLAARRAVVLAATQQPQELLEVIKRHQVTLASLVPAQVARLLEVCPRAAPACLRAVLVGGGPCPPQLLAKGRRRGWPLLATYGLTEACSQVATVAPGQQPVGCGQPLLGVQVRVVDGEIQVRGATLFDGYVESGVIVPAVSGEGWFPTGDLGELDGAGNLHVWGRKDELIVTGGENVAPAEVEAALQSCQGIAEALVVGVPDPVWGAVVGALVVASGGGPPPAEELQRHLALRLAAFKRPRLWRWVAQLPLTPAGKPDRAAARVLLSPRREVGNPTDSSP